MLNAFESLKQELESSPRVWLVTGAAGFIGSNLVETLLKLGQQVVGLDNFATGYLSNLQQVETLVGAPAWKNFRFIKGDICSLDDCREAVKGVDYVLHQAALGSVPRSINDPITTNKANVDGFLNMLVASKDAGVKSFTYAASSSTYGDHPALPKVEGRIGRPLSPYAVTKYVNELYADVFARTYGFRTVGLRYFNIFGRRQDPHGAYAAVIPTWTAAMIRGDDVFINGDGETSRDFCYVENAVQANLLAATTTREDALNQVYNVAVNDRTTLNQLFGYLREALFVQGVQYDRDPVYRDFRAGDVRHSQADIDKASCLLGYQPSHAVQQGISEAMPWYIEILK